MKRKVCIVEDNEDIGYILNYFLMEEGFEVCLFTTVADFSDSRSGSIPDIFLLDVMLPDGDGISLCDRIKRNIKTMKIPVLMMSAHAHVKQMSMETCADGFISKPFDLDVMLSQINSILKASKAKLK